MKLSKELIARVKKNEPTLLSLNFNYVEDGQEGLLLELIEALKTNTHVKDLEINCFVSERAAFNAQYVPALEETLKVNTSITTLKIHGSLLVVKLNECYERIQRKVKCNAQVNIVPKTNPNAEWQCYATRSNSMKKAWTQDQESWARLFHANVNAAVEHIRAHATNLTAKSFYAFLANRRYEMADQLGQLNNFRCMPVIGYFRRSENGPVIFGDENRFETGAPGTPVSKKPPYGDFYDYLAAKLHTLTRLIPVIPVNLPKASYAIKRNGIELSKLSFTNLYATEMEIMHPPVERVDPVFDIIEPYFQAVIQSNCSLLEKLEFIARMVWWLAQVMPLERGSAATTEMDMRALMKFLGLPMVPYVNDVPIDLEAIFEPDVDVFVKKFLAWFPGLLHAQKQPAAELQERMTAINNDLTADLICDEVHKTLKESHHEVIAAFKIELQQYQSELRNIKNSCEEERHKNIIANLQKKVALFESKLCKFKRLRDMLLDKKDGKLRLKTAENVNREEVLKEAGQLIEDIAGSHWDRISMRILNFFVKAITLLGIPICLTSTGAYVGTFVGGLLGAPSVFIAGPFGIALTTSLGALIGGGIGAAIGTGTGLYTSHKISFFKPLNVQLQSFTECATDFAKIIQCKV